MLDNYQEIKDRASRKNGNTEFWDQLKCIRDRNDLIEIVEILIQEITNLKKLNEPTTQINT